MVDADPLISGSLVGQSFSSPAATFAEVPDNLRAEDAHPRSTPSSPTSSRALFGGTGRSQTTVLDQTFNDVDLVGRPLTIGNLVTSSSSGGLLFATTTNTYTPYIVQGDEALPRITMAGSHYRTALSGAADQLPTGQPVSHWPVLECYPGRPGTTPRTFTQTLVTHRQRPRQGLALPEMFRRPGLRQSSRHLI